MAVHTAYVHLLAVDVEAVAGACLDGAESELVLLYVERLAVGVNQGERHLVTVRRLCGPQFGVVHLESYVGMVAAGTHSGGVLGHFLAVHVADCGAHLRPVEGVVEQDVGVERPVGLGVNRRAFDVDGRFAHYEHRAEYAAEVPIVGAAFGEVDAFVGAFLADGDFEHVLLVAEEHTVGHVIREAVERSLVQRTGLALVDHHLGVSHRAFKHEVDVMVGPFGGQGELVLVHTFLVGDAVRKWFAVELHAVLVSAEALQLPARRHSDFCPFA